MGTRHVLEVIFSVKEAAWSNWGPGTWDSTVYLGNYKHGLSLLELKVWEEDWRQTASTHSCSASTKSWALYLIPGHRNNRVSSCLWAMEGQYGKCFDRKYTLGVLGVQIWGPNLEGRLSGESDIWNWFWRLSMSSNNPALDLRKAGLNAGNAMS